MLDSILSAFEANYKNLAKEQKTSAEERTTFLNGFEKLCEEYIQPVMNEIGHALKDRCHDYVIHYRRENKNEKGGIFDSRITMDVYPNGKTRAMAQKQPAHIAFFALKNKEKVGIHEKILGTRNAEATAYVKFKKYTLPMLTRDEIEREIMDSIDKIFHYDPNAIVSAYLDSHSKVV